MTLRRLALLVCALATLPATAQAAAPTATTQPAKDIGQTGATLVGTVSAGGAVTSVRFDIGTSTAYGLASNTTEVAADATDATVEIVVGSLSPDTTYHFRIVATNADGTATGQDATFRTAPATPPAPGASTGSARNITATSATLTGTATLQGQATKAWFEYGSRRTPDIDLGSGTGSSPVSANVTGLSAGRTYSYRLVVQAAAGTRRGSRRSFRTASAVSGASVSVTPNPVPYGTALSVTGRLSGGQVSGTRVAVEILSFPFTGTWRQVGPDKAVSSTGRYEFTITPLLSATQVRVITRSGARIIASPVATVASSVRVGFIPPARRGSRLVARGSIRPAIAGMSASLQRRSPTGRWTPIARQTPSVAGGRLSYRFEIQRRRRGADLRVVVRPPAASGYVRGISRARFVHGLRRR